VTSWTRYWLNRYDDGTISALVRIRKRPNTLWSEFFRQGEWHEYPPATRYLYDPLAGDEITEEEAVAAVGELGYQWPGEPAPSD
jgi:hypothetical protein